MTASDVIARRRRQRADLLETARTFVEALTEGMDVAAAVVVGSVARGDFHDASDIDLIVVARGLLPHPLRRLEAAGPLPSRLQLILWTPSDWTRAALASNPLCTEANACGVWLYGSAEGLETSAPSPMRARPGSPEQPGRGTTSRR